MENPNKENSFPNEFIKDFAKRLAEEHEVKQKKIERQKQLTEWGKLGGRPKKEIKKTKIISLRFTPDELDKIIEKSKEQNLKIADYCRIILSEKTFPKVAENKLLITYAHNFSRISNFIKMGIFTDEEKKPLLDEIKLVIAEIRENIKWS